MSTSAIDLRHLRYFVAVVDHGGFRAAALHLHVSQPPLTRQIHKLEDALDSTLLIRKARGVELTDAGRAFYTEARNILTLMEQTERRTRLVSEGRIGRLDIGVFGSAIFGAIPRIVSEFRRHSPKVEVALHTMDRAELLKALRERRLTLGFNRFFEDEPGLKWETIETQPLNVAVHQSSPLASKQTLSLADIASGPLIMYPRAPRPGYIDHVLKLFQYANLSPRNVQEVDDVPTAVSMTSSNLGMTVVPDSACNLRLPGVNYIPLAEGERGTLDLCIIYRDDDDSVALHEFLRIARVPRSKYRPSEP